MESIIQELISGKEWIFSGVGVTAITALISWLLKRRKNDGNGGKEKIVVKTIVHTHTEVDKSNKKHTGDQKKKSGNTQKPPGKTKVPQNVVRVKKIKPYVTGIKEKIYNTNTFYKKINYNLGVEVIVQNPTKKKQKFEIRCRMATCTGNVVYDRTQARAAPPNQTVSTDIYVPNEVLSKIEPGKYRVRYWIDGRRMKEFTILSVK